MGEIGGINQISNNPSPSYGYLAGNDGISVAVFKKGNIDIPGVTFKDKMGAMLVMDNVNNNGGTNIKTIDLKEQNDRLPPHLQINLTV